ncbi:MAG TPA: glucoamylase family protein [Bryobacteraceae bacterium]|nr:glucoamylase family protein [Bryobacteraceae bacterium]
MSVQATAILEPRLAVFPPLDGAHGAVRRLEICARILQARVRNIPKNPELNSAVDRCLRENYSFVQFQIRDTKRNLRPAYLREALRAAGQRGGEPRLYRIATRQVASSQEPLKPENLPALAEDVRGHTALTLCELWGYGAMLRLAVIENLCADLDSEAAVSGNIQTLRWLENVSWRDFVESVSAVEETLRTDPAGVYPRMDFETRDRYRHVLEKLARRSGRSELEIAEQAIERAQAAMRHDGAEPIETHVGYYLIGSGAPDFVRSVVNRVSVRVAGALLVERWPGLLYTCGTLAVIAMVIALFEWVTGPLSFWMLALLIIPASQIALEIVNSLISHCMKPQVLPNLDFSGGIPSSCQTMVVVPCLLLSPRVTARLVEDLEIRYLANRDPNLLFGLLTDFPDAAEKDTLADSVLDTCIEGINLLNARYGSEGTGPFYLFHRAREWNAAEGRWMGRERKRGKLNSFNKLLLGTEDSFDVVLGDRSRFASIRYVITLDADTQLPRDTAAKMIGAVAHPLNRPVLDPESRTITRGYALIRPRVAVSMESAGQSLFAQIFSGMAGFDPYAIAVSDVYQDLFGLTSFTGKGIYDLAAFDAAVGDRFPDNAILSHDLIEGEHLRVGFLPTVELVEDYPATYQAFSKRKHRWVRGDWQLLPWLFAPPRTPGSGSIRNPLGLLSHWKIFDNLRRSFVEITLLLFLAAGLTHATHPARWALAVVLLLQLPSYADLLLSVFQTPERRLWSSFLLDLAARFLRALRDTALTLVFLPHQAFLTADAIVRTLYRRFVSRRKLLEWETMAQAEAAKSSKLGTVEMYFYLSSAAAVLFLFAAGSINIAMCLIAELWVVAPLIAWWLNQAPPKPAALSEADRTFLHETALRTWRFFADSCDADHHWLVPDNVQHDPFLVASRISPTNLGLQLTAQLAAYDFGYVTAAELAISLRRIFHSMERMPRYRGHFYNWYETEALTPLAPRYVSSVDSGNLAASLCTLRQGLLSLQKQPVLGPQTLSGIRDHVLRLREQLPPGLRSIALMRLIASLLRQLDSQPTDLFFWEAVLEDASGLIARVHECLSHAYARQTARKSDAKLDEVRYWDALLRARMEAVLAELYDWAPWLAPEFESELRVNIRDTTLAALMAELSSVPVLTELPRQYERIRARLIERLASSEPLYPALRSTLERLLARLPGAEESAVETTGALNEICTAALRHFDEIDFTFLVHKDRNLLRIGYDTTSGRADEACYDLLASEARTAVFLAIAKGQLPRQAWFKLGRKLTAYRNHRCLISWSGTMFEYLMPLLYFRLHEDTLLGRALRGAVRIQQAYARERNLPWGISEAAYAARDGLKQYQYRAFGVPPLSMQPNHSHALVVAPYASMLALSLDAAHATANLRWMASLGCFGRHGFFDSIDYSGAGSRPAELVRTYMAHHQGMGLMAIDNALLGGRMQERFHQDPLVQATEFLLQERISALVDVVREDEQPVAA